MTKDEIEFVAVELAKAGNFPWFPGRERGFLKPIAERYREQARVMIEALDRHRARKQDKTCGRDVGKLSAERLRRSDAYPPEN